MSLESINNFYFCLFDRQFFSFSQKLAKSFLCSECSISIFFHSPLLPFCSYFIFLPPTHIVDGGESEWERFQCSTNTNARRRSYTNTFTPTTLLIVFFCVRTENLRRCWCPPPSHIARLCRCSLSCNLHIVSVAPHFTRVVSRVSHFSFIKQLIFPIIETFHPPTGTVKKPSSITGGTRFSRRRKNKKKWTKIKAENFHPTAGSKF